MTKNKTRFSEFNSDELKFIAFGLQKETQDKTETLRFAVSEGDWIIPEPKEKDLIFGGGLVASIAMLHSLAKELKSELLTRTDRNKPTFLKSATEALEKVFSNDN